MKKQVKRWLSVITVVLLAIVNLGAVAVKPIPLEAAEKEELVEFQNNSVLCDTGCGGYLMQRGEPVLARGFDRNENTPTIVCSYPLVCANCQKHTWYHARVEWYPRETRDASMACDTGCGGYLVQQGKPILAQGFDREQGDSAVFCSYRLVCQNCGKHTWSHVQTDLPGELVKEAAKLIW